MLGLPKSTEMNALLTKKRVYETFTGDMTAARKKRFDRDIARMVLVHQLTPDTLSIPPGKAVGAIYVMQVTLRRQDIDWQSIALLFQLIQQRMVLVLQFEGQYALAVDHTRLIHTPFSPALPPLPLRGVTLDGVWANMVAALAGVRLVAGRTLEAQLARKQRRDTLEKKIIALDKKLWAEKQPKRKYDMHRELQRLKQELEAYVS